MELQQYQSLSAGTKLWLMGRFAWTQKPWGALAWVSFWIFMIIFMGPLFAQSLRWSTEAIEAVGVEKGSKNERELVNFLKLAHQVEGHRTDAETYQELAKKSTSDSKIWIPERTFKGWMSAPMPTAFAATHGAIAAVDFLNKESRAPKESLSPEEFSTLSIQTAQKSTAQWNAHRARITSLFLIQHCPYLQSVEASTPWASPEKISSACSLLAEESWLGKFAIGFLLIFLPLCIWLLVCLHHETEPKFLTWAIKTQASFKTWMESRGECELARLEGVKISMSAKRARSGKPRRGSGRL